MFGISKVKYILFLLVFIATSSYSDIIHYNNTSKETKLIKLSTNMGDITLELYADKAPETVANFLKYTKEGKLNGTIFHRVIPNFMIQGGGHLPDMSQIDTFESRRDKINFMRILIREGIKQFDADSFYMSLTSVIQ